MSILENAQIGNIVQINLELSKDRLAKDVIDAVSNSPVGTICDFRITDGKGIGVVLKLSNGKEQWFFENEIDILDENGNIVAQDIVESEKNNSKFSILKDIDYENNSKIGKLINPINFLVWLIVSLKDVF